MNTTAQATITVTQAQTAQAVGSGSLPVFATPMMVALMENAACRALAEQLEPGQTSVGTAINVRHLAPSPLGAEITATAVIAGQNGRSIDFEVTAYQGDKEIGTGTHTRVIVDEKRFMEKLK